MTSWADSDTESDVDNAGAPPKKLDAFGESESESESESEEESEVNSRTQCLPQNPESLVYISQHTTQKHRFSALFPSKENIYRLPYGEKNWSRL